MESCPTRAGRRAERAVSDPGGGERWVAAVAENVTQQGLRGHLAEGDLRAEGGRISSPHASRTPARRSPLRHDLAPKEREILLAGGLLG